jgi:hypothetical protein
MAGVDTKQSDLIDISRAISMESIAKGALYVACEYDENGC